MGFLMVSNGFLIVSNGYTEFQMVFFAILDGFRWLKTVEVHLSSND